MTKHVQEGSAAQRSTRAALLRQRYRADAWASARRDVLHPVPVDRTPLPDGSVVARTPFVNRMHASAARASHQAMEALLVDNAELVREIHIRAMLVVRHHDQLGERDTVHHLRLNGDLGVWVTAAHVSGERNAAVAGTFTQAIDVYWHYLSHRHPDLRRTVDSPGRRVPGAAPIVMDERWSNPLTMLSPPLPEPVEHHPYTTLARAIRIVTVAAAS